MFRKLIAVFGWLALSVTPSESSGVFGFYSTEKCFPAVQRIVADSASGFGHVKRLKLRYNGRLLLSDRDYRIGPGDSLISLAFEPVPADSLCLEIFHSVLFKNSRVWLLRLDDVPVLDKSHQVSDSSLRRPLFSGVEQADSSRYRLNYGGNKSMTVTVGGEGGLNLEQALQLDVDGQLSETVFIKGHLSDQEIPIQPEGNTATLREVDQIYVKLHGKRFFYTLGDYQLDFGRQGIDGYTGKVQGMQAHFILNEYRADVSLSLTRGQYHSHSFKGEYGRQTDYFLRGKKGEEFITVLAGTEKVWRNGERLIRGRDYQIEYGEGRIDFLNRLIITGENQFTVEFQYTDKDYPSLTYSGEIADTAGRFNWSVRAIAEQDFKDSPDAFVLSPHDKKRFSVIGDDGAAARTLGMSGPYKDSIWVPGLYTKQNGRYEAVDSTEFQGAIAGNAELVFVAFSPETGGSYSRGAGNTFYYDSAGGGYGPGQLVSLPVSRNHFVLGLDYHSSPTDSTGHGSTLSLMGSRLDKNLFSREDDDDNLAYGWDYSGFQTLGRPLDKKGLGKLKLRYNSNFKSGNYESFHQLVEEYSFIDTWNLPAVFGERHFRADRVSLEEQLLSGLAIGTEMGRASGYLGQGPQAGSEAFSDRLKGYVTTGSALRGLHFFTEKKEANLLQSGGKEQRDNYKTGFSGRYALGKFVPGAKYEQDEWLKTPANASLLRSLKRDGGMQLETQPLFDVISARTGWDFLYWQSNFNGLSDGYRDSVQSFEISQKFELFNLGPWRSDLFVSYQNVREWDSPSGTSTREDFKLMEWNNRLQDFRKGYAFSASYKVNQTVDKPLERIYEKTGENGNYSCVELRTGAGVKLECVPDEETGDYVLVGLRRDSIGFRLQDLNLTGNLSLSPGKFPWQISGVLADLDFSLPFVLSRQDDSPSPGMAPVFSDRGIRRSLGGRNEYRPSVRWTNAVGDKTLRVGLNRSFSSTYGSTAFTERRARLHGAFTHEINLEWTWILRQELVWNARTYDTAKVPEAGELNLDTRAWNAGAEIEKKFRGDWLLRPAADFGRTFGKNGASGALSLYTFYPRLRIEKNLVSLRRLPGSGSGGKGGAGRGRIYGEYGLSLIGGKGEQGSLSRINGFDKGTTHRFLGGVDFKIGQYIYANGSYLLRLEPKRRRPYQRMTAEARAVF